MAERFREPWFIQRCRVCGAELVTRGRSQSALELRNHIEKHSEREMLAYARQEALRGV